MAHEFPMKAFLDFEGLAAYDRFIKEYINKAVDSVEIGTDVQEVLNQLENIQNSVNENTTAIETLNGGTDVEGSVQQIVTDAVADLVGAAPETFDTLKEIADWIASDETSTTQILEQLAQNTEAIEALQNNPGVSQEYVDMQDKAVYDSIGSIAEDDIVFLFLESVQVADGQTLSEAIANLEDGQKLVLDKNSTITDDIIITNGAVIDANGSTFTGEVKIKSADDVSIVNAVFTNPVITEEV